MSVIATTGFRAHYTETNSCKNIISSKIFIPLRLIYSDTQGITPELITAHRALQDGRLIFQLAKISKICYPTVCMLDVKSCHDFCHDCYVKSSYKLGILYSTIINTYECSKSEFIFKPAGY